MDEGLRTTLDAGMATLYGTYQWGNGMFENDGQDAFWTTANAFETSANYWAATGADAPPGGNGTTFLQYWANSVAVLAGQLYTDAYRDDHLWWILAAARLYEVSGGSEPAVLAVATDIYAALVGPWHAWNTTCGGMNWYVWNPYVNAITNQLFLTASMRLATLVPGSPPVSNYTYEGWAATEWAFLNGSAMWQAATGLYQDGLSEANCSVVAPGAAYWTYNQGVLLWGAAALANATATPALTNFAASVASAAVSYFGAQSPDGLVLRELSCGSGGLCSGLDGQQFKGVFVRHLGYALPSLAAVAPAAAASLATALRAQANSILTNAAVVLPGAGGTWFSQLWQGPYVNGTGAYVAQASAIDALLAAATL